MKKGVARVRAMERGEKLYVPENPCARGHLQRRTSDGTCVQCKRDAETARTAANREAYNARKQRERRTHLPKLAEKMRAVRATESPEVRAIRLEKAKLKQREWRLKNPRHENTKKVKALYKLHNPGKRRADVAKRRAAQLKRTPAWLTADDLWAIEQAHDLADLRTKLFGFQWHVDHILPLQGQYVSGLHTPANLQVVPWRDNVSKANKYLPA